MRMTCLAIWVALAACEPTIAPIEVDAGSAQKPPPPSPGRELAPAAGRLAGGAWKVDVQLGSLSSQSGASGGRWTVRSGAPLNP